MNTDVDIIDFDEIYLADFRLINREWIDEYYQLDQADLPYLDDPYSNIIKPGGMIIMARLNQQIVGTISLCKNSDTIYQIRKLGVLTANRGNGIGRMLVEEIIRRGQENGAQRIILETGTRLKAAIKLYEQLGFIHKELLDSDDCRCDVRMELSLL